MKLKDKGWLFEYLQFRRSNYSGTFHRSSAHPDHTLYNLLQPMGMLYGAPVNPENLDPYDFESLSELDKMKVLLAESLINSSIVSQQSDMRDQDDFSGVLDRTIEHLVSFYNQVYPEISTSSKTLFGGRRDKVEVAEKLIGKRIAKMPSSREGFWNHFFFNSLVFLDIYFFGKWIHTSHEPTVSQFFQQEKEDLRFNAIRVIVAAAHANDIIEIEERKLFEHLMSSAQLSSPRIKEGWHYLEKGITVEEISPPENNSWLLKKYFLELAILTVWADRVVDQKEIEFLQRLNKHFGFFEDDLEKSMMAIEGFVLSHWKEIGELQSKKSYEDLGEEYEEKLRKFAQRSEAKIIQEIRTSEKITRLIQKNKQGKSTSEDDERLKDFLFEILQKLPAFSIVALPSSYLTLPFLLKILPEGVVPD